MPLSELLYRLAKGKFDSSQEKNPTCSNDLASGPEDDFLELIWENGQIQSSRGRKIQNSSSLPSQTSKIREKDTSNGSNTKMGRFGAMDSVLGEVPMSVPSIEMGLNQEDDMVPWLNYPLDDSLQHDYCSEFMTGLSGVTVNDNSHNHYASFDKRSSGNQLIRDSSAVSVHNGSSLEQEHMPKVSSIEDGDASHSKTSASQLYPSPSQQCQASFPYLRSRGSVHNSGSVNNRTGHASSQNSIRATSLGGCFPSIKFQKQIPLSTTNSSLMNFSHFSRPASLVKANLHNICTLAGPGISSIETMGSKDKGSIASSSNPDESMLVDTFSGLRKDLSSHCHPVMLSSKVDDKPSIPKLTVELLPAKQPESLVQEGDSKNDKSHYQIAESANRGLADCEKISEPVVAASSVCSGNSLERVSDEPTQNLKRKHRETEESEGPSEDVEEESIGVKKPASARGGTGSKRSRAAEVHNLSERRRRDRINEKMRALQELIPNCNKVDKASMLDEAIEYLKALQLQVQIMSMGAGLYMPSMMLPPGLPHMHAAHMAQFSPMSVGMGFGMGMPDMMGGSSGCSMIQMPSMHGAHFPSLPMLGPSSIHGMGGSNFPIFGLSSQGHPMPYPCTPLMPVSGGPLPKTARGVNAGGVTAPVEAPASSLKDCTQNVNSQAMHNCGTNSSMNQTSGQPDLVQNSCQASEVTDSGALKSANGDDNVPGGAAAGCD